MFSKMRTTDSTMTYSDKIDQLKDIIKESDGVIIGAGSGLSSAAGLTYTGLRFETKFADFIEKYNLRDMYSAGFYPYDSLEEYWAYWSRHIYWNRYEQPDTSLYGFLLSIVKNKDYFVLTTNVDHSFQIHGFDKERLFYTQGDYGLWQCSVPCHHKTYDNKETVFKMVEQQKDMKIPSDLIPYCPKCGKPMSMNLRCDNTFVQDSGWYEAYNRYEDFIKQHDGQNNLYLELGVGTNTPGIIKYPFWNMVKKNKNAKYCCVNYGEADHPDNIKEQSLCINAEIDTVITDLNE